jgi:hypothetical protein
LHTNRLAGPFDFSRQHGVNATAFCDRPFSGQLDKSKGY